MTETEPIWRQRVTSALVLSSISWYQHANGRPPSLADLAGLMGIGKTTALWHIRRLEAEGKVTREGRKHRTVKVVQP